MSGKHEPFLRPDFQARPRDGHRSIFLSRRQSPLEHRSQLIKLDSNENPFGPSPRAIDAMRSALSSANSYPDDDCTPLRLRLAEHHGLPPEQVLVTAGSTALLSLLCQTLLAPGLNAVTSERSFIVYSMAVQAAGARLIEAPMRPGEDSFDLEAILAADRREHAHRISGQSQ